MPRSLVRYQQIDDLHFVAISCYRKAAVRRIAPLKIPASLRDTGHPLAVARRMFQIRATRQIMASPVTKRGIIFVGTLLLMMFFAANGINILTNGKIGPTEKTLLQSGKGLSCLSRLMLAAVYLVPTIFLALLVWKWSMWRIW